VTSNNRRESKRNNGGSNGGSICYNEAVVTVAKAVGIFFLECDLNGRAVVEERISKLELEAKWMGNEHMAKLHIHAGERLIWLL
jgi:hypothetical protein